jgi:hydrogenase maturation protein HypF
MYTASIKLYGIVQGVGFRPFVAKLAKQYHLRGWVLNKAGQVEIEVSGEKDKILTFYQALQKEKPKIAQIMYCHISFIEFRAYDCFVIKDSQSGGEDYFFSPPDFSICEECLEEMKDPINSRYQYPFINCMYCGPRYSIIEDLPYDRHNTTMASFKLCHFCDKEYHNINNRRYHAEPISCDSCGPSLWFISKDQVDRQDPLNEAIACLKNEKVIAIKGTGGFHLAALATSQSAVEKLRTLKQREAKPFAIMFASLEELKLYAEVEEDDEHLLVSKEGPIVLLTRKASRISSLVYGVSSKLGCFLPYTPLHQLLLEKISPLVLTSANFSNEPIITEEQDLEPLLKQGLDGVLTHDRKIMRSIEDSVIKRIGHKSMMIRRGRGYVPLPLKVRDSKAEVLALGSDLKATFALTKKGFTYVSPPYGDLQNKKVYESYRAGIEDWKKLFRINPQYVVEDFHPDYLNRQVAKHFLGQRMTVQHHHAHIASVLAEHHLEDKVLGIAFDGVGYGLDQNIWGGEFFITGEEFTRVAHLKYLRLLSGDAGMKEGYKVGVALLKACGLEHLIPAKYELISKAIDGGINTCLASSMGRIFDGISYLLGLGEKNGFEGELAIKLEELAKTSLHKPNFPYPYTIGEEEGMLQIDLLPMIKLLMEEVGKEKSDQAYRFHYTLSQMVLDIAILLRERQNIQQVALSGGVWQNELLLTLCLKRLEGAGFRVFFNEQYPSHDGNIAVGQTYLALKRLRS